MAQDLVAQPLNEFLRLDLRVDERVDEHGEVQGEERAKSEGNRTPNLWCETSQIISHERPGPACRLSVRFGFPIRRRGLNWPIENTGHIYFHTRPFIGSADAYILAYIMANTLPHDRDGTR